MIIFIIIASRKRCDLKTRKRCDFYSAAPEITSDSSAISSAIFSRFSAISAAAIFLRLRFFGTLNLIRQEKGT